MDIKDLLLAWGEWANDHHDSLGCKSPSEMLMRGAPLDDGSDKPPKRNNTVHISDEDALMVDRAVGKLARHSVLLWAVLRLHYQWGWSMRRIAKEYLTPLEYPNDESKKVYHTTATILLERAVGVIEGAMMNNA